jgi:glycosyltransferase domain-containing protein
MNCDILLLDSSHEKFKKANRKVVSSFSDLKLNHLDHFSSETNFYTKIALSKDYLNRKFTVMCADDDFIIPKALDKSIEFLNNNSDHTAVGGYYLLFLTKKDQKGRKNFYWQEYLSSLKNIKNYMSSSKNDLITRLNSHFSFYFPTIYYLHHTDFLKLIFEETLLYSKDYDFAFSFGELLLSMLTVIYGKFKTLNIIYGARECVHTPQPALFKSLNDHIKEKSFDFHYTKFKDCLVKHLSQKASIDLQTAGKIIDEGMNLYIQRYIRSRVSSSGFKNNIRSIGRILHYFIINLTQYQKLSFKTQINLKNWENNIPPSEYFEDFMDIQKYVLYNDYGI